MKLGRHPSVWKVINLSETELQLIEEILRLEKELEGVQKEKEKYVHSIRRQELSEGRDLTADSPAISMHDRILSEQHRRNKNFNSIDELSEDLEQKIEYCIDCILKTYR